MIIFLMIRIMHVLCTGDNFVSNENCPLTVWRWTLKVFDLFIYLFITVLTMGYVFGYLYLFLCI